MNRHRAARALGAAAAPILLYLFPQVVLAHQLNERYVAPLPLAAYVAGAALAVAMSFIFVMLRKSPAPQPAATLSPQIGPTHHMPRWLRYGLQLLGILAWVWIVGQTFFGGNGDGDVSAIFLWIYGWVGLAFISGLLGPVWPWLNPFATIHQMLSAIAERLGISGGRPAQYPTRLGRWPAIAGFLAVVWLELVFKVDGGQRLGLFMIAYTFISVVAMAFYGREVWLSQGETFSVWFGLLGRLAPYALDGDPGEGRVIRRPFASGLLIAPWTLDELVLVSLATGAIIFDGLSQTQNYFDVFVVTSPLGTDPIVRDTITAGVFLVAIVSSVLAVARVFSVRAVAAGLLPVAVGYLVAHYLTYLLVDGQRIVLALNDPLQRGDSLFSNSLAFWQPSNPFPTSLVWTVQLGAVIGGHIVGAWAGHTVLAQDEERMARQADARSRFMLQLPLAILMVSLTTLTLWSLGQAVIVSATPTG